MSKITITKFSVKNNQKIWENIRKFDQPNHESLNISTGISLTNMPFKKCWKPKRNIMNAEPNPLNWNISIETRFTNDDCKLISIKINWNNRNAIKERCSRGRLDKLRINHFDSVKWIGEGRLGGVLYQVGYNLVTKIFLVAIERQDAWRCFVLKSVVTFDSDVSFLSFFFSFSLFPTSFVVESFYIMSSTFCVDIYDIKNLLRVLWRIIVNVDSNTIVNSSYSPNCGDWFKQWVR